MLPLLLPTAVLLAGPAACDSFARDSGNRRRPRAMPGTRPEDRR